MTTLEIGQPLPPLKGAATNGEFDASALIGQPFVIYFYPKDNTPGCTTEAGDFRDRHAQFEALGCAIYGVSRDSLASHQRFIEKQNLPFALISDPDETWCTQFGVMKLKNMYGKKVRGIERSTFLVDKQGILVREWRAVRVPGHVDAVLQAVRELAA